ncbi:branched-chain amino acid ABC transporter permease [Martelella sp. AMO21009]
MSTILLQALLNGIASGAVYGLIALGLSLQFGVMKIINFAHGSFLMIAMYIAVWATRSLGLHPLAVIVPVAAILFVAGYYIQRFMIEPIYRKEATREPIGVLIFTTGLWIFLDHLFLMIAGPDYQVMSGNWSNEIVLIGDLIFSLPQIAGFVIATLVTIGVIIYLGKTRSGRMIRATGQDREAASVLGIDSAHVYQLSFAIGLAVVGVAGCLLVPLYPVNPFVGDIFGLRAFIIVVLGGMGSIGGAFWGGIIIGILESVGAQFVPVSFAEALIFIVFLAVLYIRPAGLFGLERE